MDNQDRPNPQGWQDREFLQALTYLQDLPQFKWLVEELDRERLAACYQVTHNDVETVADFFLRESVIGGTRGLERPLAIVTAKIVELQAKLAEEREQNATQSNVIES